MRDNFDSDGELVRPKVHNWRKDKRPPHVFSNKEFLKLRWEWYAKLDAEGFQDIEYFSRSNGETVPVMDGPSAIDLLKNQEKWGDSKTVYYTLCEAHTWNVAETYGKSSDQLRVWKIHCEGYGSHTVAKRTGLPVMWCRLFVRRETQRMYTENARSSDD